MFIIEVFLFILFLVSLWILYQKTLRELYIPKIKYPTTSNEIITFNINKFPWSCKSLRPLTMLNTYSIILLQECYNECYDPLEYWFPNYYISRGTLKGVNLFNSGLAILSQYPIITSEFHRYKHYNACSLDCLSEKGFLSVLLQLDNGEKIRVINTHLQSSDYEKYDKHALLQLQQLLDYTRTLYTNNQKYIIGGDFNIDCSILSKFLHYTPSAVLYVPKQPTIFIDFQNGITSNTSKEGFDGMTFDYFISLDVPLAVPTMISHTYSDHNPVVSKLL